MKKKLGICLLGLAVLLTASSAWAQGGKGKLIQAGKQALRGKIQEIRLTRKLKKRMLEITANTNSADLGKRKAFNRLKKEFTEEVNPYELYPDGPDGLTFRNLGPYMATKDFLEHRKLIPSIKERARQKTALLRTPGFEERIRKSPLVPEGKETEWLFSQIKPDIQYLLIGEEHYSNNVEEVIAQLVGKVPGGLVSESREIILFSEFYGEEFVLDPDDPFMMFAGIKDPVAREARDAYIPIVGLEPPFAGDDGFNLWENTQVEGVRLRNARWLEKIRAYREKYPDALFIIHAGRGHISYYEPFSLGKTLAGEKTFVVEVGYERDRIVFEEEFNEIKSLKFSFDDEETIKQVLDELMEELRVKNRVLWLEDPQEARLFGFDARLTVKK
ncbi:MAG: hypothetical protein IKO35_05695 [Elusimicrobiaceae bacterium]|nr:hypothetical protein [Elusimicrobiaceae bacterium]